MVIIQLGGWAIDPEARTISHGSRSVRVTPKAMRVLRELLDAAGKVVSRERLIDAVWPNVTVGEEVLTHAIAEIRRAFERTSGRSSPLKTIYKSGYQLSETASPANGGRPNGEALASFAPFLTAQCLSRLGGIDNCHNAIRLYRESLAHDPEFGGAHSGLALKLVCCRFCYGGHPSTLEHALEHARIAINLDRSAAEPYLAYGHALSALGDLDGAITGFKAAIRLAPNDGEIFQLLGIVMFRAGAIEAASAACDRAAALLPDDSCGLLRSAKARRAMNDTAGSAARVAKARARVERSLAEDPDDVRAQAQLVTCLVETGQHDEALHRAEPLVERTDSVTNTMVGALARSGEVGLALDKLEAVIDGGWSDPNGLSHDPDIAILKREPRFNRITAHMR